MSIYNKIKELSIAIIALVSLVFNILFPSIVLAKEDTKNSTITFDFSDTREYLPFKLVKDSSSWINIVEINNIDPEKEEIQKLYMLPVEPTIVKTSEVKLVLVEPVPVSGQANDEIADKICKKAGIADLPCWQDLKAMRQKESYDGKAMVGDGGRSRGWYHIQTKMHNVTVECALDFECSTEWTVKNLLAHDYLTNRAYAISRHNGGGIKAKNYAKSVIYNSAKFGE